MTIQASKFKKHNSPLRYPGGKSSFSPLISQVISTNNLNTGHYLEPYAGGAGVAMYLLLNNIVRHVHINDLDHAIYAFWYSVKYYPHELMKLIEKTPVNIDEWLKCRDILKNDNEDNIVKKGFASFFLNRTNRSGILKGGVIGGKEQTGRYKLDARYNKLDLLKRIHLISANSTRLSIYSEDSFNLLKRCDEFLPKNSLIYLDPPYYVKGKGLYRNFYNHEDHEQIAQLLQSRSFQQNWIVSYDNVEEILDMYKESLSINYGINYAAKNHYVGSEVMFFSETLCICQDIISSHSCLKNIA